MSHRDAILRHVNDPNYRPVKPKVIAKKLGAEGDEAVALKKAIKKLVKGGQLAYGPAHLVCPIDASHPAAEVAAADQREKRSKHLVGIFRRNPSGYGFVRPEGTRPSEGREADIFVPAKAASDAASGDTVRVRLASKVGRMGKYEGRIIDVVQRATNRFVGVYFEEVGTGMVRIDGNLFAGPIPVGDPGAKGVQTDDKVVMEMVRFPSHVGHGEGVIVEVLGARGAAGVDTLSIIHEFDLPGDFPDDALDEARHQAEQFDEKIVPTPLGVERRDLTSATIITIDPATARDFDDAISIARLGNGHWLLGVHIADVSHFVQPKTPLDREARDRATSVYLPDRVIPMLPEVISNNLASLQPDRIRYAFSAQIEFSPEGVRIGADLFKSAIKSCRRFAYEEVDSWLNARGLTTPPPLAAGSAADAPPPPRLTPEVDTLLGEMFELAMILRKRRFERGALELSMPDLTIDLDREGRVCGAHLEQNTESHQMIEEFMLAANEAVAEMLADKGLLFLRRVHAAPDPRKLEALTAFVKELGIPTESLESRFALQKLLEGLHGDPRQPAVNFAVLRSMQRAVYSPEEEGHFALASDNYCHFTSPIRRYPDLTVHRLIEALLAGQPPKQALDRLLALGDHCSEREQRATAAERELNKVKLLSYLAQRVGTELDGIVTGVESFGLFITGAQIPAEGFVHISGLVDDYYRYDRAGHVIRGRKSDNSYRLGDPVRVAVASVDVDRRELDFRLLGRLDQPGATPPQRERRPVQSRGPAPSVAGDKGSSRSGSGPNREKGRPGKGGGKKGKRRR